MNHLLPKLQGSLGSGNLGKHRESPPETQRNADKQCLALGAVCIGVVSAIILLQPSRDWGLSVPKPAYGVYLSNLITGLQQAAFKIIWAPVKSHPSSQPLLSPGKDDACTSPLPNGLQRNLASVYNICKIPLLITPRPHSRLKPRSSVLPDSFPPSCYFCSWKGRKIPEQQIHSSLNIDFLWSFYGKFFFSFFFFKIYFEG